MSNPYSNSLGSAAMLQNFANAQNFHLANAYNADIAVLLSAQSQSIYNAVALNIPTANTVSSSQWLDRLRRRVEEIEALDGTMPDDEVERWRAEAREFGE